MKQPVKVENLKGKKIQGEVIKLSSEKTVKVRVEKKQSHPLYGKIIKTHKNYLVHNDPDNGIGVEDIKIGDVVVIQETRPISKSKKFVLLNKLQENDTAIK